MVEGGLAGGGEGGGAAGAVEELGPQFLFEAADLGADPGLADVDALGRAGEVLFFGDRDEVFELPQFHDCRF